VGRQLSFVRNKELGFDKENLLVMTVRDNEALQNLDAFKEQLGTIKGIKGVTSASGYPGNIGSIIVQRLESADGTLMEKAINFIFVDYDYLDVMGHSLTQGRYYDRSIATEAEEAMIINQAVVTSAGWGDDAIGKKIDFGAGEDGAAGRHTRVIGVVKDFHYASLHNSIDPLMLVIADGTLRNIIVRTDGTDTRGTIEAIEEVWQSFNPDYPFEITFMDENMNRLYEADDKIGTVFRTMALLCISIACLGLFGLAAYTAEQRTKEIGIRKVMGANVSTITVLLSSEFIRWVLLANIIAWPISYIVLNRWLENFAYRIQLLPNFWIFILAAVISFIIAIVTVVFQTVRAANRNPIRALRYE
jgi:putative ABC transport system permease protein